MPKPKNVMVSVQMARMPRASTGPEVALRRSLHSRGLRFRLHRRELPGTPDIVMVRPRLAVFVDGCFWHNCPDHCTLPKNNRDWWEAKFEGNRERDRRKDAELIALGWTPHHVWEHEDPDVAAERIAVLVRRGPGCQPSSAACGNLKSTD